LRDKLVFTVNYTQQRIQISFYNKQLTLPQGVRPAIEKIVSGATCVIEKLQSNMDEAGRLTLAQKLLAEGMVEIVL
jgi:hypothetical protein